MQEIHISMQEGTSLVWRNAFYLDSLNINDLPRLPISMEEGSGRQRKAVTGIIPNIHDYYDTILKYLSFTNHSILFLI